jgi:hypothetical protein
VTFVDNLTDNFSQQSCLQRVHASRFGYHPRCFRRRVRVGTATRIQKPFLFASTRTQGVIVDRGEGGENQGVGHPGCLRRWYRYPRASARTDLRLDREGEVGGWTGTGPLSGGCVEERYGNRMFDLAFRDASRLTDTVQIAYVMKHLGISLVDAYLIVRSRRLSVLIQPNMRLLYNLLGWELKLIKERCERETREAQGLDEHSEVQVPEDKLREGLSRMSELAVFGQGSPCVE